MVQSDNIQPRSHWTTDRATFLAITCFLVFGSTTNHSILSGRQTSMLQASLEVILILCMLGAAFVQPFRVGWRWLSVAMVCAAAAAVSVRPIIRFLSS
jgi:hypothetical protein